MKYFYIHPFKPQYFFPKDFKQHEVFISFFNPYSLIGKTSWFLFKNFWVYRNCFAKNKIEKFIPEQDIRQIIGLKAIMAFNTGTPGPEQKITALGLDQNNYFFIKYAQTSLAIKNVVNEHKILLQLSHLNFVPKIQDFYLDQERALLKTDVLMGVRLNNVPLNQQILDCLYKLSKISVTSKDIYTDNILTVFAHGDFCPWNMMEQNGKILVFDWEMGGDYPLGYDVFTFLFQTHFLLEPEKTIHSILSENKGIIDQYFDHFKISEWNKYLKAFSRVKINIEKSKGVTGLLSKYEYLLDYAEKA